MVLPIIDYKLQKFQQYDNITEMKGYKCNNVLKVKQEWVCIFTTSKAKSLGEMELG